MLNNFINISEARERIGQLVANTPLAYNKRLSEIYNCEVYLKREDLQIVRSYKLRGALNMILTLQNVAKGGVYCASAGNHAQGVAFACSLLNIKAVVYVPEETPVQKVNRIRYFGKQNVIVRFAGKDFDECSKIAAQQAQSKNQLFIPAFDHALIIAGQGTVGSEITEELPDTDYVFVPIGGGGLAAGICQHKVQSASTFKIIGCEPEDANSMMVSIQQGAPTTLAVLDSFVEGAAVRTTGKLTYAICQEHLYNVTSIPKQKICSDLLDLFNEDGILCEPAAVLGISALDHYKKEIANKKVVCIITGSNLDSRRMSNISALADEWKTNKNVLPIA